MSEERIEPEDTTVDSEEASVDESAADGPAETATSPKRGRRFLAGVLVGGLVGAASAIVLGRPAEEEGAEGQPGGWEAPQDASGGASGGLFASLRSRWREASSEARVAAREAEGRKRARFLELTELKERR